MEIKATKKYFICIKETIDNSEEFENELMSETYEEALNEAEKILIAYYKSYSHCRNNVNHTDLIAELKEKIVLEESV